MIDYIDYESIVFALGGDTICPSCGIGVLIPEDISNPVRLQCDVCDSEFIQEKRKR